ncbi:MAG: hypothetical protein GY782_01140 [Gammaproteobacteria bacterium]|nr:hypothetical protein [Gammaproteobacteria bacterium]
MAGNTRGKIKEHFQGVHKNFEWALHHVAKSMTLIASQLSRQSGFKDVEGDAEKEEAFFEQHPMYRAMKSLGEGIATLDGLAEQVHDNT